MTPEHRGLRTRPAENAGEFPLVATLSGALGEAARVLTRCPHVSAMIVARRRGGTSRFEYLTIAEDRWPGSFEGVGWERTHRMTR